MRLPTRGAAGALHRLRFAAEAIGAGAAAELRAGSAPRLRIAPRATPSGLAFAVSEPQGRPGGTLLLPAASGADGSAAIGLRFVAGVAWLDAGGLAPVPFRPALAFEDALDLHLPPGVTLEGDAVAAAPEGTAGARPDAGPSPDETPSPMPSPRPAEPAPPAATRPAPGLAPVGVVGILPCAEGVLLHGWYSPAAVAPSAIRLAAPGGASPPLSHRWLDAAAPSPAEAPQAPPGAAGFLACAALPGADPAACRLEVGTAGGLLRLPLPPPRAPALPGLLRLLGAVRLPADRAAAIFDEVLGPPLVAAQRALAAQAAAAEEIAFGESPAAPRASIVVPLHGRLDLMAAQLALFSAGGVARDEILYVLDDPPRREEFLALAESCLARFGHPFRALLPPAQLGFGGASNLGLERARGEFVCFLNSDAFPRDGFWLHRLAAALADDPAAGAAGPLLLYPDGTVQHAGMSYERIPGLPGLVFPTHPGKGLLPPPGLAEAPPRPVPALTGACLLLRRGLARELGGFGGDYLLGDFEDADLCERLRARGLARLLVPGAVLVHLERVSQGDAAGAARWNATLLNAWSFARRFGEAALADAEGDA
jgi:GT2 family glycosyltransferase